MVVHLLRPPGFRYLWRQRALRPQAHGRTSRRRIPGGTSQNAITEGDFLCILARNCEGTEQLQK